MAGRTVEIETGTDVGRALWLMPEFGATGRTSVVGARHVADRPRPLPFRLDLQRASGASPVAAPRRSDERRLPPLYARIGRSLSAASPVDGSDVSSGTARFGRHWPALLLAALFCLEAVTLLSFYRSAVAPFPPEAYDQAAYLSRVYELTDAYDTYGIGRLLRVPFEGGAHKESCCRSRGLCSKWGFGSGGWRPCCSISPRSSASNSRCSPRSSS